MGTTATKTPSYQPEQRFFNDPVLDRLMAVTMTLAAEVYVLRDRIDALECRLAAETNQAVQSPDVVERRRNEDAAEFARHILSPLLGEQQSKGAI